MAERSAGHLFGLKCLHVSRWILWDQCSLLVGQLVVSGIGLTVLL